MKQEFISTFIEKWRKYFNNAELPITFYYSDTDNGYEHMPKPEGFSCLIKELKSVREGNTICHTAETVGCGGGKRYTGFSDKIGPDFPFFLSYGIEGKVEGERYKKNPEVVLETMKIHTHTNKEKEYLIFKRWDKLTEADEPDGVIFFAKGEVLSGLFTLANYDQIDPNGGVFTPFGPGCSSIIHYPYLENEKDTQRAVIGMFDPSSRKAVGADEMTFTVPMKKFESMVANMDESFLITKTWGGVMERIN